MFMPQLCSIIDRVLDITPTYNLDRGDDAHLIVHVPLVYRTAKITSSLPCGKIKAVDVKIAQVEVPRKCLGCHSLPLEWTVCSQKELIRASAYASAYQSYFRTRLASCRVSLILLALLAYKTRGFFRLRLTPSLNGLPELRVYAKPTSVWSTGLASCLVHLTCLATQWREQQLPRTHGIITKQLSSLRANYE